MKATIRALCGFKPWQNGGKDKQLPDYVDRNKGLRHGNDRRYMAKAKIIARRNRRAKGKEILEQEMRESA